MAGLSAVLFVLFCLHAATGNTTSYTVATLFTPGYAIPGLAANKSASQIYFASAAGAIMKLSQGASASTPTTLESTGSTLT